MTGSKELSFLLSTAERFKIPWDENKDNRDSKDVSTDFTFEIFNALKKKNTERFKNKGQQ